MKSDKEFYGGRIPQGGEEVIFMNGKAYSKVDIDYIKSQSKPKSLDRINTSAGFKPTNNTEDEMSNRDQQLERLTLLKSQRARLQKDLDRINKVITAIEKDL